MKYLTLLIAGALIAGCATTYSPRYYFKQVDVVNLTGAPLKDLSWKVVGSGKQMTCEEVAPNRICTDYFPRRHYPRAGIELNWIDADGKAQSAILNPAVPAYFYTSLPLSIFIEIDPEGTLRAYYRQDTPGDRVIRKN